MDVLLAFQLSNSPAVHRWNTEIQEGIFNMLQKKSQIWKFACLVLMENIFAEEKYHFGAYNGILIKKA
jgi:hypothetical protein